MPCDAGHDWKVEVTIFEPGGTIEQHLRCKTCGRKNLNIVRPDPNRFHPRPDPLPDPYRPERRKTLPWDD